MIRLKRIRDKKAIPSGLRGPGRIKKSLDLLKLKRDSLKEDPLKELASKQFKSNLWKPAKKQLRVESNDKCAYCEADTKVVAHGDVEHFRPKTVYWFLAYCYDNYLYSCQICNQTFKSNKFPVSGSQLASPKVTATTTDAQLEKLAETLTPDPEGKEDHKALLDKFIADALAEEADLIDPYITDPEDWLVWEADDELKEVAVKVKPRKKGRAKKQIAIDDVYGLNREELRKVRYMDYKTAETLVLSAKALADNPDVEKLIKNQLRQMTADDHRFAGMTRFFVKKKWKLKLD